MGMNVMNDTNKWKIKYYYNINMTFSNYVDVFVANLKKSFSKFNKNYHFLFPSLFIYK